tara:strand:- start:1033 stop:2058 length:1026 start_codon:yes stop_codon:yes gene_type:complete
MPGIEVTVCVRGKREHYAFDENEVLVGRMVKGDFPALIVMDDKVSRRHARIWRALDGYWMEDLGSTHGTFKDGHRLTMPARLCSGDTFALGDSVLTIDRADISLGSGGGDLEELLDFHLVKDIGVLDESIELNPCVQAKVVAQEKAQGEVEELDDEEKEGEGRKWTWRDTERTRLATRSHSSGLFGRLADIFSAEKPLEELLELAVKAIVETMEPAERGAVLLLNESHTRLEVGAHFPVFEPAFSRTLALKVLASGRAFTWERDLSGMTSDSIKILNICGGIYAPIAFGSQQIGVACVDSTNPKAEFTHEELALFINTSQVLGALIHGKLTVERSGASSAG